MTDISQIKSKFEAIKTKLDYQAKKDELAKLEEKSHNPNLWENPSQAQELLQSISALQKTVDSIQNIESDIQNLTEIRQMLDQSPDPTMETELENSLINLTKSITELETQTYLSGKYDSKLAILSIHAGQGGTEAMDWASMLQRMYIRFLEKKVGNMKF